MSPKQADERLGLTIAQAAQPILNNLEELQERGAVGTFELVPDQNFILVERIDPGVTGEIAGLPGVAAFS